MSNENEVPWPKDVSNKSWSIRYDQTSGRNLGKFQGEIEGGRIRSEDKESLIRTLVTLQSSVQGG